MKKKKRKLLFILLIPVALIVVLVGVVVISNAIDMRNPTIHQFTQVSDENAPVVYMTTDISPEGLMAVYQALGVSPEGRVAVKITTGEPSNSNYLRPELIQDLVQMVDGTLVETNTAYGGRRANTAFHLQVAEDHGFTAIAPVDILDSDGEMRVPVNTGNRLSENIIGSNFDNYDFHIILSHFKGHQMAGYGGAMKNISIGYASSTGKGLIHGGGRSNSPTLGMILSMVGGQTAFLEAMADAAGTIIERVGDNIIYINVMNRLSVDCDCVGNPAEPDMHDIGILASLDPVALDKASIDLIYGADDGQSLIARIEGRNGLRILEYASELGFGNWEYRLVSIDD